MSFLNPFTYFGESQQLDDSIVMVNSFSPEKLVEIYAYLIRFLGITKITNFEKNKINEVRLRTKEQYDADLDFMEMVNEMISDQIIIANQPITYELAYMRQIIGDTNFPRTVEDTEKLIRNIIDGSYNIIWKYNNRVCSSKKLLNNITSDSIKFISTEFHVFNKNVYIKYHDENNTSEPEQSCENPSKNIITYVEHNYGISLEALAKFFNKKCSFETEQYAMNEKNTSLLRDILHKTEEFPLESYTINSERSIVSSLNMIQKKIIDMIKDTSCSCCDLNIDHELSVAERNALICSRSFVLVSKYNGKIYNPLWIQQELGAIDVMPLYYRAYDLFTIMRPMEGYSTHDQYDPALWKISPGRSYDPEDEDALEVSEPDLFDYQNLEDIVELDLDTLMWRTIRKFGSRNKDIFYIMAILAVAVLAKKFI